MPDATRATFEGLVRQTLTARPLEGGEKRTELVLTAVDPLPAARHPESFRLLFAGPLTPQLGQGVWSLEHAQLGAEAIFLVPVGRSADGVVYEAIFNRG